MECLFIRIEPPYFQMRAYILIGRNQLYNDGQVFSSIRNYENQLTNPKECKSCRGPATKDVLFAVGNGIVLIERYCDQCAQSVPHYYSNNKSSA
jgi:hypothetical protein